MGMVLDLLPIQASSIPPSKQKMIEDKYESVLVTSSNISLMRTQENQSAQLNEKALEEAGCFNTLCEAALGQELGVDHLLKVKLIKIDDMIMTELRLIHVQEKRIVKINTFQSESSFQEYLQDDIPEIVSEFFGSTPSMPVNKAQLKKPMALVNLKSIGVSTEVQGGVQSKLTTELIKTQQFELMEREEMSSILAEQSFQQSQCSEEDCAVEMGRLIGVELMTAGTIVKIGDLYSLNLRVFDVATGKILKTASIEFTGDYPEFIENSVEDAARLLAGLDPIARVNTKAIIWTSTSIALWGLGAWAHLEAIDYNEQYNQEFSSTKRLLQLKDQSQNYYISAASLYTLGLASSTVALYHWLNPPQVIKGAPPKSTPTVKSIYLLPQKDGVKFTLKF